MLGCSLAPGLLCSKHWHEYLPKQGTVALQRLGADLPHHHVGLIRLLCHALGSCTQEVYQVVHQRLILCTKQVSSRLQR